MCINRYMYSLSVLKHQTCLSKSLKVVHLIVKINSEIMIFLTFKQNVFSVLTMDQNCEFLETEAELLNEF